jgi:hypothetical protein
LDESVFYDYVKVFGFNRGDIHVELRIGESKVAEQAVGLDRFPLSDQGQTEPAARVTIDKTTIG